MQYLHFVAAALMSHILLATAEVHNYRDLIHGVTHEARAVVNDAMPLGYARVEARKLVARQGQLNASFTRRYLTTVTVTVTSIPEYCTPSASSGAIQGTSGLSAGVAVSFGSSTVITAPSGGVSGNITSIVNGITESTRTAEQSTVAPSASAVGSSMNSTLVLNVSSTITTVSSLPASTASETTSSTASALPTSNDAASYGPGLAWIGALIISWAMV